MDKDWFLYIVRAADNSLYTGITLDVDRRLIEHNTDKIKGAKSLRGKKPVKLVYTEEYDNQHDARVREAQIKKWNSSYKWKLIERNTKPINK